MHARVCLCGTCVHACVYTFTVSLFHSRLETRYLQRILNYMHNWKRQRVKMHVLQQHLDVIRGHTIGFSLEQMNTLHIETKESQFIN